MGMKKITKEIDKIKHSSWSKGWDEGYAAGQAEGYDEAWSLAEAEERRCIETVIKMKLVWAMENNKGTEIVFWKNALELLIDLPQKIANQLTEDSLREELKDYGF